jgi:hypothetical protein
MELALKISIILLLLAPIYGALFGREGERGVSASVLFYLTFTAVFFFWFVVVAVKVAQSG